MGGLGGNGRFSRIARLLGLGSLALANCANGNMSSRVDPKSGVSANARVVEPGEPVPKGGGVYRVGKPYMVAGRKHVPREDVNYSAVADDVPKLDVTASCRGAATAAHSKKKMQGCLDIEQKWHDQLVKQWSDFAAADHVHCVNMMKAFSPTYTELLTCLENARDLKRESERLKALEEH